MDSIRFSASLITFFTAATVFGAEPAPTITLTDAKAIEHAVALEQAIDKMSQKVSQCVAEKLAPPEKCFCRYPSELRTIGQKYKAAVKSYPEWKERVVFWTEKGGPMGHNLVIPSIRKQLQVDCSK